jgi:hypothetical protein
VDRIPLSADPSSGHAHDLDFCETLLTFAIQAVVTAEAPTRWALRRARPEARSSPGWCAASKANVPQRARFA